MIPMQSTDGQDMDRRDSWACCSIICVTVALLSGLVITVAVIAYIVPIIRVFIINESDY